MEPDVQQMDKELVKNFAKHHVRMGKVKDDQVRKMIEVSSEIVNQLVEQGLNSVDIAFIMLEISKVRDERIKEEMEQDMAFV